MLRPTYIKEWRKRAKLTQKALAEKIGYAQSYVTMIERGDRRYDQLFLEAAAAVLDCTPADLIARPPGQNESIATLLATVDEAERHRVEAAVRAMISSGG